jgi:transcriptional regulator with XRE-family HTH domain
MFHTPQGETSHSHPPRCRITFAAMDVSESFRRNLLAAMAEKGETAAGLSRKAGLNPRAVKDIEEGRAVSPKLSTVFALAYALNLDPAEMMGLGRRANVNAALLSFLEQYDEAAQEQLLAALAALPPAPH